MRKQKKNSYQKYGLSGDSSPNAEQGNTTITAKTEKDFVSVADMMR